MKINLKPLSVNQAWRGGPRYRTDKYDDFIEMIQYMTMGSERFDVEVEVNYKFYIKNYARSDVGNFEKTLSDALVKAGVLKDDSLIKRMTLEKFKSKEQYIEIDIKKYEE